VFFEKFTQSLDELAREMDFFSNADESIASLELEEKQRMVAVLEAAFEDVLIYLTGVMRIFFKSDGSKSCTSSGLKPQLTIAAAKSKARVFGKAVWSPFRFEYIVERMKAHRSALRDEALLHDLRARRKAVEAQEVSSGTRYHLKVNANIHIR